MGATKVNDIDKLYFGGVPTGSKLPSQITVSMTFNYPLTLCVLIFEHRVLFMCFKKHLYRFFN